MYGWKRLLGRRKVRVMVTADAGENLEIKLPDRRAVSDASDAARSLRRERE